MTPGRDVENVAVIVVAAGSGERLRADEPKAFVRVGGATILAHALHGLGELGVPEIVVVAPSSHCGEAESIAAAVVPERSVVVVAGGLERADSVRSGVAAVSDEARIILVHDAARCFMPPATMRAVADEARVRGESVIPTLAIADTVRVVSDGLAVQTLDRSTLAAAQTPQAFPAATLRRALEHRGEMAPDDAALVRAIGEPVHVIEGHPDGFKITVPHDLVRAERLVAARPRESRLGMGSDVHRFGPAKGLWLGGVFWPDERALEGHSDADAAAHAVVDAVLAAAGLGDIGGFIGDDLPEAKDASSVDFLVRAAEHVTARGWRIDSVSVSIQALRPKISARRADVVAALSAALGGVPVSVTASTTDGLGFVGRGEGVAVTAVAQASRPATSPFLA